MTDLLIITPLPPHASNSALLGDAAARFCAAQGLDVTLIIEDLAPTPPSHITDRFSVFRQRELISRQERFRDTPRLYIIGDGGDSLFALELFKKAPGAVLLGSNSLFNLVQPALEAKGDWPEGYWRWLYSTVGPAHAETLYGSKLLHRRETPAQASATPALDLLLGPDAAVIAPSPYTARQLAASGLSPARTLQLALTEAASQVETENPHKIKIITDQKHIADHVARALGTFTLTRTSMVTAHPRSAPGLLQQLGDADIIVLLDGAEASACPVLATAMSMGKPVITAGQAFAAHLPATCHITIPHAEAADSLVIALQALITQAPLRLAVADQARQYARQASEDLTGQQLLKLAAGVSQAPLAFKMPEQETVHIPAADGPPTTDINETQIALIGAPPPDLVLAQMFPSLDLARCPRFATPAIANRLAEIGGDDAANMLARTGFEAPLVATKNGTAAHRPAHQWHDLARGLAFGDKALSFACAVDGVAQGDALLARHEGQATLPIRIAFDDRRDAPTSGYVSEAGLFWRHDTIRHRVTCILLVGIEASFTLETHNTTITYIVADKHTSQQIAPDQPGTVRSDHLGLLEFTLAGFDVASGTPASSEILRKALAEQGLILEWSQT